MSVTDVPERIQEVYKKWESKSAHINSRFSPASHRHNNYHDRRRPRSTYSNRNTRFDAPPVDRRNSKFYRRPDYRPPKYENLVSFKMAPVVEPVINARPFVGLCCPKCLPQSRAAIPNSYIHSLCVCNLFLLPHEQNTVIPAALRPLYYIMCRNMKFRYPDVANKALQSDRVKNAIENAVEDPDFEDTGGGISESNETLAQRVKEQTISTMRAMKNLKASISPFLLRLSALVLYKLLPGVFRCIHVHRGQIEILKTVTEMQEDCPIVYIPVHCSDLDFALISLILYMNDLKVPLVAADEHPEMGTYLRKLFQYLGAFFVKPKLRTKNLGTQEIVYQAVLKSYMIECLKAGHSLEISSAGYQLHSQKHLTSGSSLLGILIDAVLEEDIDDVYIAPVSISYEKIADRNFIPEQLGRNEKQDRLLSFWKSLFTYLCTVRVDFSQPFSLKEFLSSNKFTSVPKTSLPGMETPPSSPSSDSGSSPVPFYRGDSSGSSLLSAAQCLTSHITYDAVSSTALMSTHLLSFLFLTKHRQGGTQPQLVCSFNLLREELLKRKKNIGFIGESADVVKHAISLLGKELICTEAIELEWTNSDMENNNMKFLFHKPVVKLPHVIELQYYSSFVLPCFLLDSIMVNALYAVLDGEICHFQLCDSKLFVSRQDLIEKATELCSMLQFEFVCIPPCSDLDSVLNDVVEELLAKECLHIAGNISYASSQVKKALTRKSNMSFMGSDEEDDSEYAGSFVQNLKVDLRKESVDHLEFLRCILSPYIESYWLTSCTLLKLLDEVVEERDFIKRIQRMAEDRLGKGLLCYEESFCARTLKNALKLFESRHIIEHYREDDMKVLYLSESYDSEEKLSNVISSIEEFRK